MQSNQKSKKVSLNKNFVLKEIFEINFRWLGVLYRKL